MKPYNAATLAALGDRRASKRNLLRLDLAEGTFGFWGDSGDFTYDSVLYRGAGKYLNIKNLGGASDFSVTPIEVTLSSIPDSALTPDVLGTIHSYTWHQRPATLYDAYFVPGTRDLIMVERIARRIIDTIDMVDQVDGQAILIGKLQPLNYDNPNRGFMRYADADQRLIDPADGFFKFSAIAGTQEITWGRLANNAPTGAGSGRQGGGGR